MARFDRKAKSQPKHGPASISGASKAPFVLPVQRPGWKGPGYIKKAVKPPPPPALEKIPRVQEQVIPEEIQQLVLDTFRDTFPESNDFDALKPVLREIKDAIAQKSFELAVGTDELLEKYTIRWAPSKALACSNILAWVCREWQHQEWIKTFNDDHDGTPANVVSFGRGAADFMALVALLKHLHPTAEGQQSPSSLPKEDVVSSFDSLAISEHGSTSSNVLLRVCLVDRVDWSGIVSRLHKTLTTPPVLSQYASAKARASNHSSLSPQSLSWSCTQLDILDCGLEDLRSMIGPNPSLLTFFFTLSELYSISISKVSVFLLRLTAAAPKGSLLLVVDSPGVDVETTNEDQHETEDRKYPFHWLLYKTLMPQGKREEKNTEEKEAAWEKLVDEENTVKLSRSLRFPVSLENIKFQVHLLRRL
jgi:25S rRNA (uracil2843-N3)-methyltransferase